MEPKWLSDGTVNHYYIPPRYGRGNRHDGWTSICGNGKELSTWIKREEDTSQVRCVDCQLWLKKVGVIY